MDPESTLDGKDRWTREHTGRRQNVGGWAGALAVSAHEVGTASRVAKGDVEVTAPPCGRWRINGSHRGEEVSTLVLSVQPRFLGSSKAEAKSAVRQPGSRKIFVSVGVRTTGGFPLRASRTALTSRIWALLNGDLVARYGWVVAMDFERESVVHGAW
jgi:hypothetical protein